ncbi:MAG: Arm DNA-binding domain-containing protein [Deltaproteobacteria bacterium]|nr:Arm DNA-binding domain-containing protein [Deltaproteobacteria bacterium]
MSAKTWRFDYKFETRQTITFGSYPEIGVKQARELLENAKTALKNGVKPMAQKKT